MAQSSPDSEHMGVLSQMIGYILEPLLHAVPYPYIALHPVLTAARHVQSFETSASSNGYKDFMAELDTDQARYLSTVLAGFYFLSKAVKLFLWVPASVAAVQAVPKVDAQGPGESTQRFCADIMSCLGSIPLALWGRFGIYYCVAAIIDASTRVIDATFQIKVVHGGLEDSI
ncbi:hypothetical protein NW752_002389 [Fusarium irregulare]|nr:hypothetical protein NW752_002389 [Fusarium irregulare]